MIADISASFSSYGPTFTTEVEEITKYRVNRYAAYNWARNLRFLTYDDEIDSDEDGQEGTEEDEKSNYGGHGDGTDVVIDNNVTNKTAPETKSPLIDEVADAQSIESDEDEQAQLDRAIAMSLAEDGDDQNIVNLSVTEAGPSSGADKGDHRETATKKGDRKERSCASCESCPEFPPQKRARHFKIVQFHKQDPKGKQSNFRPCSHYVAVSYCWPKNEHGVGYSVEGSYRVRTHDSEGKEVIRSNRVPDDVIDKVVEFAKTMRIRLIWIDQECLPQDGSGEQELGIQAMDMVYQRARVSVGLLSSVIQTQGEVDAIGSILDSAVNKDRLKGNVRCLGGRPADILDSIARFFQLVRSDPWTGRAWILQEALSAAWRMMLLIRMAPGVHWRWPWHLFDYPQLIPGTLMIGIEDVQRLIEAASSFLLPVAKTLTPIGRAAFPGGPPYCSQAQFNRLAEVLESLANFHPGDPKVTTLTIYAEGGHNFGPRKTCSAAVAVWLLKDRGNTRPADRLAIIANLCDYEARLDTVAVSKRASFLSNGILALALMNGDMSLLIPDLYQSLSTKVERNTTHDDLLLSHNNHCPSWMPLSNTGLQDVQAKKLDASNLLSTRNHNRYQFRKGALQAPAYLWKVERMVDVSPVKHKWQAQWNEWESYMLRFHRLTNDGLDQSVERLQAQTEKKAQDPSTPSLVREMAKRTIWTRESVERLRNNIFGITVEQQKATRAAITMLHGMELKEKSRDSAMIGNIFFDLLRYLLSQDETALANSIWQSIRIDAIKDQDAELPDFVDDSWLSEYKDDQWRMLQLDIDQRGTFNQMWLIHRIMKTGGLWAGRYIKNTTNKSDEKGKGSQQVKTMEVSVSDTSEEIPEKADKVTRKGLLSEQLYEQTAVLLFKTQLGDWGETIGYDLVINVGALVTTLTMFSNNSMGDEAEARRRFLWSTFDVDGPCLVAVPYDVSWEKLPHPEYRTMSVCWIVEPVADEADESATDASAAENGAHSNHTAFDTDDAEVEAAASSSSANPDHTPKGYFKHGTNNDVQGRFRVLGMVKGMWEIHRDMWEYQFV